MFLNEKVVIIFETIFDEPYIPILRVQPFASKLNIYIIYTLRSTATFNKNLNALFISF